MKLITVLLVDDDYLVLQDLKSLVDWESLGFQIVGTATNGKKALTMYQKYKPQLIITDISMPVMDGLSFIETVRESNPNIHILIISSYAHFEYAKRAIANGVNDYILKNEITKETLTKKLSAVSKALNHTLQSSQLSLRDALYEYFLFDEPNSLDVDEIPKFAPLAHLLKQKYFFIIFSQQLPLEKLNCHFDRSSKAGKELSNKISDISLENCQIPVVFYIENMVFIGIEPPPSKDFNETLFKTISKNILLKLDEFFPDRVLGFYIPEKLTIPMCKALYKKFKGLLSFYFCFPTKKLMNFYDFKETQSLPTMQHFNYDLIQISQNDPCNYYDKLQKYLTILFQNKDISSIMNLYHNTILRFEEITKYRLLFNEPQYLQNLEECMQFFKTSYELCLEILKEESAHKYSSAITKAIEFMKLNFSDSDLTTEQIAEHVMLSSGRLCVLFKQETGTTIIDYLTDLRIQYAIYLLENTNYKIYEITEQVGYKSSQYFSQIFNQRTGKRPIDFRKSTIKLE